MSGRRIDVHAHFLPEVYRRALAAAGIDRPDGIRAVPAWDEQSALETMDLLDVELAMLSISSPGVHLGAGDRAAAQLARAVNEEAAALRERHPGRFGFFASVPLPDVPGAVTELQHSLDVLGADGVVVETNSAGTYLGNPVLEPLYAELSSRSSVLFVHPTTPHCAEHLALGYPRPMLEFMFETTRSITDLVLSGAQQRHPEMRVLVPHAGAALPVLVARVELLLPLLAVPGGPAVPSLRAALQQLHFDLAGAPVDELLEALLAVADPSRIHYGSDYPFTPADTCLALAGLLEASTALSDEQRVAINGDNARALFPRLA